MQFLDLQEADKGIVKRDDRFGHLELADGWSLERAVEVDEGRIRICGSDSPLVHARWATDFVSDASLNQCVA